MAYATVTTHDEVVPGAAPHAERFLATVLGRSEAEGIPLRLASATKGLGAKRRSILRAEFRVGGLLTRSPRYRLEVFADPIGSALHVGFQVDAPQAGVIGPYLMSRRGAMVGDWLQSLPRNQRELAQLVGGFDTTVFVPTVQQLVDAVE